GALPVRPMVLVVVVGEPAGMDGAQLCPRRGRGEGIVRHPPLDGEGRLAVGLPGLTLGDGSSRMPNAASMRRASLALKRAPPSLTRASGEPCLWIAARRTRRNADARAAVDAQALERGVHAELAEEGVRLQLAHLERMTPKGRLARDALGGARLVEQATHA